jgi:hypothetical protein
MAELSSEMCILDNDSAWSQVLTVLADLAQSIRYRYTETEEARSGALIDRIGKPVPVPDRVAFVRLLQPLVLQSELVVEFNPRLARIPWELLVQESSKGIELLQRSVCVVNDL